MNFLWLRRRFYLDYDTRVDEQIELLAVNVLPFVDDVDLLFELQRIPRSFNSMPTARW